MVFPSKLKERYEIREELGKGGMGAVYRAYDKIIKSEVALKTLLDIADADALRMFHEECDKLARMVHPNIVEIRDIGEFDSGKGKQPYLVMPLLRGATLDRLIKTADQRLSIPRAVDILCQACRGLQAAHDAGLVHRDLKPSNIFVMEDDSVKLIDFGVAHWSENTHTVGMKGTLLFMSPEQLQMKGVSPLSDIFSLGVVAYQTLTGRSPFSRRTEEEVVQAVLNYIPPPASEYNPEVTLTLSQAVHKAMAKQPSNRYRSAREFGEVLQKALHRQPIEIFNPERIRPRLERANQVLERGDLELASEIIGELEAEGHLDPELLALQRKIEQLKRQKRVLNLLDGARTRLQEQEYPLALQKIQEALEIDPRNSDALALKESIETRRAEQSVNDWLQLARQHTDNFAHDRAREALQNVLALKPNDGRALALMAEVDRRKLDYEKILQEKEKLHQAAEAAYGRGEISSALSKMDRVLQLDKQAPDRTDRNTAYQSLYNQIRSEHDGMQNAYAEARALQASGHYSRALAICNENLAKRPGHALLQALKLDLEVSQRQQVSGLVAQVDRRVDAEPDLDKRLSILKEALDKFPEVEHFQTGYRLAREKRDLIESIVSKAHWFEEQGQIGESLAQWEILRSIYDRYPGLEFEFQRLRKRRDHQAQSEARARVLEQIEQALDANQHARALELLETAKQQFPGDADLAHAEHAARESARRVAEAQTLLQSAAQMRLENRLQESVETLQHAYTLDRSNPNVCEALQTALIEQARSVLDADWRTADTLLKQAQELGSGHYAVKGLLRAVADRRREEEIAAILSKAREMDASGDLRGAYAFTMEKLKIYPQDLDIQQLNNRLKKRFMDSVPRTTAAAPQENDPALLNTVLDRAAEQHQPARQPETVQQIPKQEHYRLMTVAETAATPQPAPQALAPRATAFERPKASAFSGPRNKVWIGAGLAAAVLVGVGVFSRPSDSKPPTPDRAPVALTTVAVRTIPPGASLVINNSLKGVGDGSLVTVPPGNVTIEASLPGYQPIIKQVFLRSGDKSTTEISLQLLAPSIRIETALNSGQVFIDDNSSGDLQGGQYTLESLPEGSHRLSVKGEHSFGFTFQSAGGELAGSALNAGSGGTLVVVTNSHGKMQVLCNRTGLTLMLDDQEIGRCATSAADSSPLPSGRHKLEVMEGKQSLGAKTLELGPTVSLGAYLLGDSDQGILAVTANVEDFTVSFDRHESVIPGRRNRWSRSLPPGDHLIVAHKDGFRVEPASATVRIEKGKNATQPFFFTAIPTNAVLTIKTEPGTEIFSAGKLLGTAKADGTAEILGVSPGPLALILRKKGFAEYHGTIQIAAGPNVKTLSLQKERAHVTVTATPAGARIVLTRDGASAGQTFAAPVNTELPDGNYTLEVLAEGYTAETKQITLAAGEPYSHEFHLQVQKAAIVKPKAAAVDWPGWDLIDGYRTRTISGFAPVANGVPSQVLFTASRERKKLMGFSRGGSLQWAFQAIDGTSALNFHLSDKDLTWDGIGQAKDLKGRSALKLEKGEHAVRIAVSGEAMKISVDGSPVTSLDIDLAKFGSCRFGFKIGGGETLSIKDFDYRSR